MATDAKIKASEFVNVEIARKEKPDVAFRGKLLGKVDSRTYAREGDKSRNRWTRLELWELASGDWVAAAVGCSDRDGEIDIGDTAKIPAGGLSAIKGAFSGRAVHGTHETAEQMAMRFFGWTWLAKELAALLKWDVIERIA